MAITKQYNEYVAQRGQSLFDIVIEQQGDVTTIFEIAELNGLKGISDTIFAGDIIKLPLTIAAQRVVIRNGPVMPIATVEFEKEVGIGQMTIEESFIIR
jgi:hypothetical protein